MKTLKLLGNIQGFLNWLVNSADLSDRKVQAEVREAADQLDCQIDRYVTEKSKKKEGE